MASNAHPGSIMILPPGWKINPLDIPQAQNCRNCGAPPTPDGCDYCGTGKAKRRKKTTSKPRRITGNPGTF